jgi:hypothetical protein
MLQEIHARPQTREPGGHTTLDYNRRGDNRYPIRIAYTGIWVRVHDYLTWEISGVDTTGHHILGY